LLPTKLILGRQRCESMECAWSCSRVGVTLPCETLAAMLGSLDTGPLGNPCRFALLAAVEDDRAALKGLGTYGAITGAAVLMDEGAPLVMENGVRVG